METCNFTAGPASKGLNVTQGTNAAFNAFMAVIAEVEDRVAKVPAMWYVFLRLLLIPHSLN